MKGKFKLVKIYKLVLVHKKQLEILGTYLDNRVKFVVCTYNLAQVQKRVPF